MRLKKIKMARIRIRQIVFFNWQNGKIYSARDGVFLSSAAVSSQFLILPYKDRFHVKSGAVTFFLLNSCVFFLYTRDA